MSDHTCVASLPREFVEKLDSEASELNMSRSRYVRDRINAGRILFDAGKLDSELLNQIMETDGSERLNDDLETLDSDLSQTILNVLPTDEDRATTIEELRKEIFGTKEEQINLIESTLKELNNQNEIRPAFSEGYVKDE